ncbi:trans-2-enoyl-CoA reductase [Kibdelosporangium aridum]|uniref:enoyl-[acyl-carrier-protein] reductase n=1 Tax=Kibdelosporangium aridum TaxID=2030 RepID=A0A428ZF57_KIBAR|nr:zinc-dependent alcohol dehydrogenase family protein [Kibdelosporangium aridum]RSM86600.1 trans-2-enoyl-CoA reductase [Kibdelosporangium aridum]
MSQLILTGIGDLNDTLYLNKDPDLKVGPDDVLIRMEAAPINPVDTLYANAWYAVQPTIPGTIGSEGVGRVTDLGANVDPSLSGKRVIIVPNYEQGVWAHTAVVPARNVVVIPDEGDALQLSMLAINPLTALLVLNNFVDLEPGDWIAQNLGSSTMARHITALAKRKGVRVLSVVRRADTESPGSNVVLVEGDDLATRVTEALGGQKLRLVLDGTANASATALASALETGGTIVTYSSTTNEPPVFPLGLYVFNDLAARGFWVVNWLRTAPREEIEATVAELAGLVISGDLTAPVDSTFAIEDYTEAIARSIAPQRKGKVLFDFH